MSDELKWKLQLFADDPDGGDPGNPDGNDPDGNDPEGDPDGNDPDGKEGEKKYTDKDVDRIVEKKFARWKAQHEKDLKDAKAEAEKLAKMNADQKKDYELEKVRAENAKLKADAAKVELGKEATKILKESKIDATQDILEFVVGEDADSTKANIDKFVGIINAQVKAAEVQRATGKGTPKNYGGGGEQNEILKRIEKYK
ncbi:MAG: DUF4355 domain-containing protein [Hornefia butyriciproducens]|uniref:DUF4355 domain-containing protein n=1 Tax=Hornefia butyriciproducens TaxID=2652293 RepID=UPI002A75F5A9|nr:DUF4355 domain-containing protein [Hornefia butyriciproducens]MDY2991628.1 DUF4355 domain-containing protein [Hornefia butyriciproducens]